MKMALQKGKGVGQRVDMTAVPTVTPGPVPVATPAAMTAAEIQAEIARLKAENEELKQARRNGSPFGCKVSEKGAVSVYGLGKFPMTLYKSQWEKLFANIGHVKDFIAAHASELTTKD